jgi:hypothetical protein
MNNQEREIMSNIKIDKSDIGILEEIRNSYFEANKPIEDDKSYLIDWFMIHSINLHKDCINRIAELEKEWAEHLKFLQTDYPENYGGTD